MRDLAGNLSNLTVVSSQYDVLFSSETLVSDMRHGRPVPGTMVPGFGRPVLLCRGKMPWVRGVAASLHEMVTEHFANPNLSVVVF